MTPPDRAQQQRWWDGVVAYVETTTGQQWPGDGTLDDRVTVWSPLEPCESCGRLVIARSQTTLGDDRMMVIEFGDHIRGDLVQTEEHTPARCQQQRATA